MLRAKFSVFFAASAASLRQRFISHCDDDSVPNLVGQADADVEKAKEKFVTPDNFEDIKRMTAQQGSVDAYDGFRVVVQKQVNLNTVVSHFYWLGSQATGQPIYQYRLILPFDDKMVNVSSDMDMNVDAEIKFPVSQNLKAKTKFAIGDQQTSLALIVDHTDETSATQLQYSNGSENSFSMSYVQAITPFLTLGGMGAYQLKTKTLSTGFVGVFNRGNNMISATWDSEFRLLYMRKVNPNRVHLSADFAVLGSGESVMSVAAEYMLKQSKLHMSVASDLQIKSIVETSIAPGVQLQLCADMNQYKGHYRCGFGIVMG